jgi:hypothetical protein
MSDRVTRAIGWTVGLLAVFAGAGAACGLLWHARLHAPSGVVVGGRWYADPWSSGEQASFASTGYYVVIAVVAGLVLGLVAAWSSRAPELVTLAAVVVGSVVAAGLMMVVGLHGAPPDPASAAAHAADGTRMSGTISRPGRAALIVWPLASILATGAVFLLLGERPHRSDEAAVEDPNAPVGSAAPAHDQRDDHV